MGVFSLAIPSLSVRPIKAQVRHRVCSANTRELCLEIEAGITNRFEQLIKIKAFLHCLGKRIFFIYSFCLFIYVGFFFLLNPQGKTLVMSFFKYLTGLKKKQIVTFLSKKPTSTFLPLENEQNVLLFST